MTDIALAPSTPQAGSTAWPTTTRAALLVSVIAGSAAGMVATSSDETARAVAASGADLAELLRFMALVKSAAALGVVAAALWRLGSPASPPVVLGYAAAAAVMCAGPGLIWGMSHVGLGALLLHGGLAASLVLLWRDPAVAAKLAEAVRSRINRASAA